ncbi:hypothetical protein PybrP1_008459 [[Pythium] brassicae (nom. inval.)]|nr:hypothetical protein PybrP1_008459 [[Pythium] brassicae (nom. inval.)]
MAAIRKRISYIGARSPSATEAKALGAGDAGSFRLETKRQRSGLGDATASYSTGLTRFLGSSGASTPRIYPIAYSPGHECDDDDELPGEQPDKAETSRYSVFKHSGAPARGGASLHSPASNGRDEQNNGEAAALATQTVQVSKAPEQGRHQEVFKQTQAMIAALFDQPQESAWFKLLNRTMFVLIILNFAVMAMETCEGKNYAGSDPGYPYLPDEQMYKTLDAVISAIFTLELLGRIAAKRFSKAILTDPFTLADLAALVPSLAQVMLDQAKARFDLHEVSSPAHSAALLRLLRAVRLGNVLRQHDQTRILYLSIRASLRPLAITMFFLFALVMLLATALFYAEPCYNVRTCHFTDIFNSAYFIMVTYVCLCSALVLVLAMMFGQMYFSMPLFIVGNNFQSTYENFQWNTKRKQRQLDATLTPFDAQELHALAQKLTHAHFHLVEAWRVVHLNIQKVMHKSKLDSGSTKELAAAQTVRLAKIKEVSDKLLGVHNDACDMLHVFVPHKKKEPTASAEGRQDSVFAHIYVRARRAMAKNRRASDTDSRDGNARVASLRGRLWMALEVPDSSQAAQMINRIMVIFALLSVFLFCCESLPELSSTGAQTIACRRVVREYCLKKGFVGTTWVPPDPGCFRLGLSGSADLSQRIDFACSSPSDAPNCYGSGTSFGSFAPSAPSCESVFNPTGVSLICYRQQCNTINTIVDMGPYWIYFEWMFGIVFTLELVLRFAASQTPALLVRDLYIIFDILSIVPFFVEVLEYVVQGVEPSYAIVATSPSFLSVIRVMKTTRILKLTRHFKGTKVLASTAKEVWRQLAIPIFFLFTGCIIAGAFFYEIERGTECYVGEPCMWWNKNVLTPRLAAGLPEGKRVMIQDRRETIIVDMIHSSWLSYATLTGVGYGDLVPRTSIGKLFCICLVITATIYSAMPMSLVGSKFYELYERHMEKMVVKRTGSIASTRTTTRGLNFARQSAAAEQRLAAPISQSVELFALSERDLEILHLFMSMKRTVVNLQRNLDNFTSVGIDIVQQRKTSNTGEAHVPPLVIRKTDSLEQSIEQKCNAVMDTLLQFSLVIEKIQDAPTTYEALIDDPLQAMVVGKVFSGLKGPEMMGSP